MSSYRKNRGIDTSFGNDDNIDEKKSQWAIVTAERVLTCLFPEDSSADGKSVITNYLTKNVDYTPDTLARRAREYFESIYNLAHQGTPVIPDIEDFCLFSHITRIRFAQYRESHELQMANCANGIANAIAMCKKQMAMNGEIPPVVFAIDFNNNHDYINQKFQVDMKTKYEIEAQDSIDDIASRLPMQNDLGNVNLIETDEHSS